MNLADKVKLLHEALDQAGIAHAFGGAIALAYCTEDPRGTVDIDINVFIPAERAEELIVVLPPEVEVREVDRREAPREGQVRSRWGETPIDMFLMNHPFHEEVARGARVVPFAGVDIPVVSCTHLAVFKAAFGRPRDWGDLHEAAETIDATEALMWVARLFGEESEQFARLTEVFVPDEPSAE